MTTSRPGRPTKNAVTLTLTPFGAAVVAAIDARRAGLREGPRSMSDLARILGILRSTLHLQLSGWRPMPAEVLAAIRRELPEIQDG